MLKPRFARIVFVQSILVGSAVLTIQQLGAAQALQVGRQKGLSQYAFDTVIQKSPECQIMKYNSQQHYRKLEEFLKQSVIIDGTEYAYTRLLESAKEMDKIMYAKDISHAFVVLDAKGSTMLGLICCSIKGNCMRIEEFGTTPQCKIGKTLLCYITNKVISELPAITEFDLLVEKFNLPAQAAYSQLGFIQQPPSEISVSYTYKYDLQKDPCGFRLPKNFTLILKAFHHELFIIPQKNHEYCILLPAYTPPNVTQFCTTKPGVLFLTATVGFSTGLAYLIKNRSCISGSRKLITTLGTLFMASCYYGLRSYNSQIHYNNKRNEMIGDLPHLENAKPAMFKEEDRCNFEKMEARVIAILPGQFLKYYLRSISFLA